MIDELDVIGNREAITIIEATAEGWFPDRARLIVEKPLSGIGLVFQHVADGCERQRLKPRQALSQLGEFLPKRKERGRTRFGLDAVGGFKTLIELIRRQTFREKVVPHETTRPGKSLQLLCVRARHREQAKRDVAMGGSHVRNARFLRM